MTQFNNLLVRPIQTEDLAPIKAFCQNTWLDETDYIPYVLDRWIAAADSQILVAVLNHEPVGMARVVKLSSTEGWWEGLRVDCRYRRLGIGKALAEASINVSRDLGFSTLRTSVKANNTLMPEYLQKLKFGWIGDYAIYWAAATSQSQSMFVQLTPKEFPQVQRLIETCLSASSTQFYVPSGARWKLITNTAIMQLLQRQWIWGIVLDGDLEGLFIRSEMDNPDGTLWNGLVTGTELGQAKVLHTMRCLANQLGFQKVGGFFSCSESLIRSLETAGYQLSEPNALQIYEIQI